MRNTAEAISSRLAVNNNVLRLSPLELLTCARRLKDFRPEVIHYLSGPTIASFILLHQARMRIPSAKIFITMIHPFLPGFRAIPSRILPDVAIFQSKSRMEAMKGVFKTAYFVPSGVDTLRFRPIGDGERKILRAKYKIPENSFVVLHVGNLRQGRNIETLREIAENKRFRVIVVSSTSVSGNSERHRRRLEDEGVIVIDRFLPELEELYACSDCYVFPTVEESRAIDMPLSILEAASSNLPIISTLYGGVPDILSESKWIKLVDDTRQIPNALEAIAANTAGSAEACDTRSRIQMYSWDNIAAAICRCYGNHILDE
ncbi:MAG: glycosyltransferase family 4 protein [Methanobacteriota archaeon]|nr:MAG: glycosyltransferase family 4 protein [Euryarchaeota archaeon]